MLMKPYFRRLMLSFIALLFFPPIMITQAMADAGDEPESNASIEFKFSGTLQLTTCDVRFNRDLLVMDTVAINSFTGPGSVAALRVPFSLHVENCLLSSATMSTILLSFDTQARTDKVAPGAFANQAKDSHNQPVNNGVGIAVFDQRDDSNVLTPTGESRSLTYPVTESSPFNTERYFYSQYMQTAPAVVAGDVSVVLVVSSFYN
ncbi:hypothetical protein CYR55_05135 [Chimaeribacter californicus]|uniref:Fimbrial protein n=1 Tax=Chimaeribacter californicus TaxID=2060067 RepID=A0A2N5EDT8_9GAMM|nr:fimbrial protein [Chimaeribacter californicus]PLR40667.1 hypothetical protein CYR55_05135 [Chimaeribacter californicus]